MHRWFIITALTLLSMAVVACGNDSPDTEPMPSVDADKVASQLTRQPFFGSFSPESGIPDVTVTDEERRLEFAGWGAEDPSFVLRFPESGNYRRMIMKYVMGSEGEGPADYDNAVLLYVRSKSDGKWYELARLFTPFGREFDSEWERIFHLDVTEYAPLLVGETEFKYYYGGFDATEKRAHSFRVSFYGYEGEASVIGMESLYDSSLNPTTGYRSWAYGVEGYDIEAEERLGVRTLNIPEGTKEVLLRVAITGHGHDVGSFPNRPAYSVINAAEFDDNYYYLTVDGTPQAAVGHIYYSNADNYYQAGTYLYDRANWAPGNPANTHYWRLQRTTLAAQRMTLDVDLEEFISTFEQPNAEGVANYIVSIYAFYMR